MYRYLNYLSALIFGQNMTQVKNLQPIPESEEVLRKRQIRLRRCPSTSTVESIVTEDTKLRRAQPDKP